MKTCKTCESFILYDVLKPDSIKGFCIYWMSGHEEKMPMDDPHAITSDNSACKYHSI